MNLEREILIDVGKTGMGKTQLVKRLLASQQRVLVMDSVFLEHTGILFHDMRDLIEHVQQYKTFRVRIEDTRDFPMLCAVAMAARRCWLVIEEAQRVLPDSRHELPTEFTDIIYRGRHTYVNVVIIAQRASTVHIAARSQWTRLISFNQSESADCNWIEGQVGRKLELNHLSQFHYYEATLDGKCNARVLDMPPKRGKIREDRDEEQEAHDVNPQPIEEHAQ